MRCYCCNNDHPVDQFRVFVGGEWVPCGVCRVCIEATKATRRKCGKRLMHRTESKQRRHAA